MTEHTIASVDEIPPGEGFGVEVDGLQLAVFNVDGEFYAMQNVCWHKEGPMYKGEVNEENCSVYCPWHYWEWDLKTGRSPVDPRKRMRTFEVRVEGEHVKVVI